MHSHLEIIMPPTDDIEAAIKSIMAPFSENDEDASHAFWDFYVIGGRWAGSKLKASLSKEKIDKFYEWLQEEKVTVAGFQAGKQEISPSSQIPKVDAKWNETFPSAEFTKCPLFAHSNDQYNSESLIDGDVCSLLDLPDVMECSHVIIAKPSYDDGKWTGPLEAEYMLQESIWNGVTHVDTKWDGKLSTALAMYADRIKDYKAEYLEVVTPKADWLVVTVDYHS